MVAGPHGCGPAAVPIGPRQMSTVGVRPRRPAPASPRARPRRSSSCRPGAPGRSPVRRPPCRFSQHLSPAAGPCRRRGRRPLGRGLHRAGCARGRFPHRPRAPAPRRRRPGLRGPAGRHVLGHRPQPRSRRRSPAARRPPGGRPRRRRRWWSASGSASRPEADLPPPSGSSPSSSPARARAAGSVDVRAVPRLRPSRRPGDRLPPGRRRRRHPPPAGVPGLRSSVHHLRAAGGGAAHRAQAVGLGPAVRPVQAGGGDEGGGQEPAGGRRAARGGGGRDRGAGPAARVRRSPAPRWAGWCSTASASSTRSPTCASPASTRCFEEPGDFQRELGLLTEADPAGGDRRYPATPDSPRPAT